MPNKLAKRGFTLIELLVVVLIIGILASIALPQYQKAVRKARLSEVATTFNAISKGIDMWLLENGYPASTVKFSGTNKTAGLDIQQSCAKEDSSGNCYTKVGRWSYYCDTSSCFIELDTSYNSDGTYGQNKWLDGSTFSFSKSSEIVKWGLNFDGLFHDSIKPEICRWWVQFYGADRVFSSGYPSNNCDAYL